MLFSRTSDVNNKKKTRFPRRIRLFDARSLIEHFIGKFRFPLDVLAIHLYAFSHSLPNSQGSRTRRPRCLLLLEERPRSGSDGHSKATHVIIALSAARPATPPPPPPGSRAIGARCEKWQSPGKGRTRINERRAHLQREQQQCFRGSHYIASFILGVSSIRGKTKQKRAFRRG